MNLNFLNFLFGGADGADSAEKFPGENRLVFRRSRRGAPSVASDDSEDEDNREREEREEKKKKRVEELRSQIALSHVSEETKQLMRQCLASDSLERHNLVENLLRQEEPKEELFSEALEKLEKEDRSWEKIFTTQREIRKKVQDLQWRTESYVEIVPRQKAAFNTLLDKVRIINRQDDATDRGLRRILKDLSDSRAGAPAALNQDEARAIYLSDPLSIEFKNLLARYQNRITAAQGRDGQELFKRLLALKKEEENIEKQFGIYYDEVESILNSSLSKVRAKAERENVLRDDSRAIGITLKEGVEVEFKEPGILAVLGPKKPAKITKIEFEEKEVKDPTGKVSDIRLGIPYIYLDNGAKFTIGRFKKWADSVDACEKISGLSGVGKAIGLADYGIDIEKGMRLAYVKRERNAAGDIDKKIQEVEIRDINTKTEQITFDHPVIFQPGFETGTAYDMRSNLSYGEFVKWWQRYEVEKSVSMDELKSLLAKHAELENKIYGIEAKNNPPITLDKGEDLMYPDESGLTFRIVEVEPSRGIALDNGVKYTFPEFLYWVKSNHVRIAPPKPKTPKEQKAKEELAQYIAAEKAEKEETTEMKKAEGAKRKLEAEKTKQERASGTLTGRLAQIWWTTEILSLKDLWNMVKEIVEFVKRKHERRSKGRYGTVGSRLPWVLGPEFERVKQTASNEEMEKYKSAMEKWGVQKVKRTLYGTNNKDIAEACMRTLMAEGELRWDDHEMWETLNRLTARYTMKGAELNIPEPSKMPIGESGEDMARKAVDALWGIGKGSEWYMETINKFNSNKNSFEYKFKQLDNDPKGTGGVAGECERMLKAWKKGEYVNPMEYEAMLDGAIKFGKMGSEEKVFYIMAGVLTRERDNPEGETLLHVDRLGELDGKYTNNYPILDYFTQVQIVDMSLYDKKEKQWGKKRKLKLSDFEAMKNKYFPDDFKDCKPGEQFARFMWETILMDEMVRTRISKGIRNAENMDHDDAHLYIPPTTPTEIDDLTSGPTGQKKYFTNEGYANAYPGFNQYFISLSYSIEEETDSGIRKNKVMALRDGLNSFIRYDAILDNRFLRKEGSHKARLDDRHFKRHTVVDGSCLLKVHQNQLRNLMVEVGREYGQDWGWLYEDKFGLDAEGQKNQELYERKVNELKDKINTLVGMDEGKRVLDVIKRARERGEDKDDGLRGIKASKRPPPEDLAKLRERAKAAEVAPAHGHGGH